MAVVGSLPSWLDVDFVRTTSGALAILALVVVLIVMFLVRSLATRIVAILVLGGAVFGLLHYRNELSHCDRTGCSCKFLGEDLKGGGCSTSSR